MLTKIRSLLAGKENRRLFAFNDGQRKRSVDPLAVWCSLQDDPAFVLERDLYLVDQGNVNAIRVTTAAVRRAFGLSAWSEESGGLTEAECIALLSLYLDYMSALKKNTSGQPTSPLPTELPPSDPSIMSAASDCSKTSTGPNGDTPCECPVAST